MKIQEGVFLEVIPTTQFHYNRILFRFATPMREKTLAGRALLAYLLPLANRDFPTTKEFKRQLGELYQADFSVTVSRIGQVHCLDIAVSYLRDTMVEKQCRTEQVLSLIEGCLFRPLLEGKGIASHLFELAKTQLLRDLASEKEDSFFYADRESEQLFFTDSILGLSPLATIDLIEKETPASLFQALQDMLKLDRLDIIALGNVSGDRIVKRIEMWDLPQRSPLLEWFYRPSSSNMIRQKIERRPVQQSILELSYSFSVSYGSEEHATLLVLNGLFGGFAHSMLFQEVREQEGLVYTIESDLTALSGICKVYAGMDKEKRAIVYRLIRQTLTAIRQGKISDSLLQKTKNLLIHTMEVIRDNPANVVETAYFQMLFSNENLTLTEWVKNVKKVSTRDVTVMAQKLELQAVYFLEGVK